MAVGENKAHKNQILAEKVQNLWTQVSAQRKVDLEWVQGHTGDTGNEAWISTLYFDLEILSAAKRLPFQNGIFSPSLGLNVLISA